MDMVPFPVSASPEYAGDTRSSLTNFSNLSVVSMHATALEVCYSVYGETPTTSDAIERFYEADASERFLAACQVQN